MWAEKSPQLHIGNVLIERHSLVTPHDTLLRQNISTKCVAQNLVPSLLTNCILKYSIILIFSRHWSRVESWSTKRKATQQAIGGGFKPKTGIFTAEYDGIFIVNTILQVTTADISPTLFMKLGVNGDTASPALPTINSGNGIVSTKSNCTKSCFLSAAGVVSLKHKDTIALYVLSNDTSSVKLHDSSTLSLDFISESFPLPNGMMAQLDSDTDITVQGKKQVINWALKSNSGSFFGKHSSGTLNNFMVKYDGIYYVSINIHFKNLRGKAQAYTSLVNIPAIMATVTSTSDLPFVLTVSGFMKILAGSLYTVTVDSETDSNYEILAESSKSAIYLAAEGSTVGFTGTLSLTTSVTLTAKTWTQIVGWTTTGKNWLFKSGGGFDNEKEFVVPESGNYLISSHIIVSTRANVSSTLELLISRNGFYVPNEGLYYKQDIVYGNFITLKVSGSSFLEKWDYIKLVMRSSEGMEVELNLDSTYSIAKIGKLTLNNLELGMVNSTAKGSIANV